MTECGTAPSRIEAIALRYRGEDVGELLVGARTGEAVLDRADRAALELFSVPLAAVVHATALADAVQRSREQIVGAREEERRRLRRDLHDGLGPVLTGIAFRADACKAPAAPGSAALLDDHREDDVLGVRRPETSLLRRSSLPCSPVRRSGRVR